MVIQYFKFYQPLSLIIDIKDDYFIFEGKKYSLKNSKITVEFPRKNPITRVIGGLKAKIELKLFLKI